MSADGGTGKIDVPVEQWDAMFAPSSCLVLDTTVDEDGLVNAAPHATCMRVCHDPVYFSVTVNSHSHTAANLRSTGQWVVNVVPFDVQMLGKVRVAGLPFQHGVNELDRAGLTALPSLVVGPPRIAECEAHFECVVEFTHEWQNRLLAIGRVVAVSVDEDCYDPAGRIWFDRLKPGIFCGFPYDGNFVPAYEPVHVEIPYDGPPDWRTDIPYLAPPGAQGTPVARSAQPGKAS
jgi:flavin reductase (DIM6/NTAB) family NADH-FMN oxidoreductase RutF